MSLTLQLADWVGQVSTLDVGTIPGYDILAQGEIGNPLDGIDETPVNEEIQESTNSLFADFFYVAGVFLILAGVFWMAIINGIRKASLGWVIGGIGTAILGGIFMASPETFGDLLAGIWGLIRDWIPFI